MASQVPTSLSKREVQNLTQADTSHDQLDAYARPPENLRPIFKKWQRCQIEQLNANGILDTATLWSDNRVEQHDFVLERVKGIQNAFQQFLNTSELMPLHLESSFELRALPGASSFWTTAVRF